jgi:hypothetical protein
MFLGQFKGPSLFKLQKTGFSLYGKKGVAGFRGHTLPRSCMGIRYGRYPQCVDPRHFWPYIPLKLDGNEK